MINDTLFGENLKLSYSRLQLLKCPIKYYITKFIGLQTYSIHSIIGVIVHKLYEDILLDEISVEQARSDEVISSYIDDVISQWVASTDAELDYKKLINIIRTHIYPDLKKWVDIKVKNGYELYVEKENTNSKVELFGIDIQTYIRPDVYLIRGNELILVDIKTARRYRADFKNQLVFYMKLLSDVKPYLEKFRGIIYLTRYGEIKDVYFAGKEKLTKDFNRELKQLNKFYKDLSINSVKDITNFVKKVCSYSDGELFNIRCKLYSEFGNVCGFCPVKDICPVHNLSQQKEFSRLILDGQKGELAIEDKIIYLESYDSSKSELIAFVGSED